MAGFLEGYGVADARRSRAVRWIVISAAVVCIVAIVLFFYLRTWPAKRQVSRLLDDLKRGDYRAAYTDWGCARGCPDYKYEQFVEDWGPNGSFKDPAAARIRKTRFCDTGIIVTLTPASGRDVALWYQRDNGTLGFSPWPVCALRIPAPSSAPSP